VRGLDVGTGASAIYPLLGARVYGWSFLGTDIDECVRLGWVGGFCVQANPARVSQPDILCVKYTYMYDIAFSPLPSRPPSRPMTSSRTHTCTHTQFKQKILQTIMPRVALEAARVNVARNSLGGRIALKRVPRADYSELVGWLVFCCAGRACLAKDKEGENILKHNAAPTPPTP
jgi:hypothetical protein